MESLKDALIKNLQAKLWLDYLSRREKFGKINLSSSEKDKKDAIKSFNEMIAEIDGLDDDSRSKFNTFRNSLVFTVKGLIELDLASFNEGKTLLSEVSSEFTK